MEIIITRLFTVLRYLLQSNLKVKKNFGYPYIIIYSTKNILISIFSNDVTIYTG